ncbi:protein SPATA45 homolog [Glandiceps talaboti]
MADSQDMYNVNMQRESWCAVERNSRQAWLRAERKHDPEAFQSRVFDNANKQESEPRCEFKPDLPTHRERRHFPNVSYHSHLAI